MGGGGKIDYRPLLLVPIRSVEFLVGGCYHCLALQSMTDYCLWLGSPPVCFVKKEPFREVLRRGYKNGLAVSSILGLGSDRIAPGDFNIIPNSSPLSKWDIILPSLVAMPLHGLFLRPLMVPHKKR